jgi:hypothetical protein
VDIAVQHPDKLSVTFMEEFQKDAELFESLAPIQMSIQLLEKKIDDTATQVAEEAYAAARTIYAVTNAPFAEAALRTAANSLGKPFGQRPRLTATDQESSSRVEVSFSTRLLSPAS